MLSVEVRASRKMKQAFFIIHETDFTWTCHEVSHDHNINADVLWQGAEKLFVCCRCAAGSWEVGGYPPSPGPRQELVPSSVLPVANPHHQRSTPSPPTHPSIPRVNQYVRRAPIDIPPPYHPADCSGRNLTSRNVNDNLERQFVHSLENGERSSAWKTKTWTTRSGFS